MASAGYCCAMMRFSVEPAAFGRCRKMTMRSVMSLRLAGDFEETAAEGELRLRRGGCGFRFARAIRSRDSGLPYLRKGRGEALRGGAVEEAGARRILFAVDVEIGKHDRLAEEPGILHDGAPAFAEG